MHWRAVGLTALVVVAAFGGCLSAADVELADEPAGVEGGDDDGRAPVARTDAASPETDAGDRCAAHCPTAGGTCDGGTCVIACPGAAGCRSVVTCPPGLDCSISCVGKESCAGVACGDAASCKVHCEGEQACKGKVTSNALDTTISCVGKDACDSDVSCSGARCVIQCSPVGDGCDDGKVRCCATSCTLNGVAGSCPF